MLLNTLCTREWEPQTAGRHIVKCCSLTWSLVFTTSGPGAIKLIKSSGVKDAGFGYEWCLIGFGPDRTIPRKPSTGYQPDPCVTCEYKLSEIVYYQM